MRTKAYLKYVLCVILMLMTIQMLQAQEAFYFYRNDGGFNGFFFDQVKRMGVSKIDLNGVEHSDYVIQEVETADSLYRIPLAAIDSIGFQQPDIILNEHFYDVTAEDCPYKGFDGIMPVESEEQDTFELTWKPFVWNASTGQWVFHEEYLPKIGDVLYVPNGMYNEWTGKNDMPFIGKVTKVESWNFEQYYGVHCTYVDNINDVFEQFISLEQIGYDESGAACRRMAGSDKIKKRIETEGNKELTLASVSGHFTPINQQWENLKVILGVDLSLAVKANVAYNISFRDFKIIVNFSEDIEVGASLSVAGSLEEAWTWQLAGVPITFPTWMPILQVKPGPGAFLKTTGDLNFTLSTPKLAAHAIQTITINDEGVTGSEEFKTGDQDENNTWGMQISLNGSAQVGTHLPFHLESASWMKRIAWASTGIDVYIGPKFEAAFTLDPFALGNADAYSAFKDTQIKFSDLAYGVEGKANFEAARKKKTFKLFEGEATLRTINLKLFPDFNSSDLSSNVKYYYDDYDMRFNLLPRPYVNLKVYPRGNSVPCRVGIGAYNQEKKLVSLGYLNGNGQYSFFNTWDQASGPAYLFDGTYTVCPVVECFGFDLPVWSAGQTVVADMPLTVAQHDGIGSVNTSFDTFQGTVKVCYVLNTDENVRIDCDDDEVGFVTTYVERRPMAGQDPTAAEYFEEVVFDYKILGKNYSMTNVPFTLSCNRIKPEGRNREYHYDLIIPDSPRTNQ